MLKTIADIEFQDENFKKQLIKNGAHVLEEIKEVDCDDSAIYCVEELKYFPNLQVLKLSNMSDLEALELTENQQLKVLHLDYLPELTDLDLTQQSNLEELSLTHMNFLFFRATLGNNEKLKSIYCSYGGGIKMQEGLSLPSLEELTLENCEEEGEFDFSLCSKLTKIDITWNQFNVVDVTKNTSLTYLSVESNKLSSINLKNNKKLQVLYIGGDFDRWDEDDDFGHTSLDLTENQNLKALNISKGKLTTLDVSKNKNLQSLTIENNPIRSLDLTENKNIAKLSLKNTKIDHIQFPDNFKIDASLVKLQGNPISESDIADIIRTM